jgi:hypothetical protein
MDGKTTFHNGNLTKNVYMTHPKGFVDLKNTGKTPSQEEKIG